MLGLVLGLEILQNVRHSSCFQELRLLDKTDGRTQIREVIEVNVHIVSLFDFGLESGFTAHLFHFAIGSCPRK